MSLKLTHAAIRHLLLLLSLSAVLFLVPANIQQSEARTLNAPADWDRYSVRDGEFSVLLPTVPAMSSYSIRMIPSGKSLLRHVIGAYSQGVVYAIYIFERKQSLDEFIGDFRHSSPSDFKRELDLGGVHGKEYGFRNDDRRRLTDYFVTERRVYVFEAQGSVLGNPDEGIPRFLDSIKFFGNLDGQVIVDGPGTQPNSDPVSNANNSEATTVSGKEVARKAVVITKPEPTYTEEARQHQTTGTVVLRCVFRSSGAVTNISVVSGLDHGLTDRAIAAAQQIKFIPPVKDGHFVSMWMELLYNFNLY